MKGKKNPLIITERSKNSEPEMSKVEVKVVYEKRPERSRFVQGLHDRLALQKTTNNTPLRNYINQEDTSGRNQRLNTRYGLVA